MEIHTLNPVSLDSEAHTLFNLPLAQVSQRRIFFCNQQASGRMEMLLTWHTGWGLVWGAVLQLWEARVYRSVNVGKVSLHVGTSKDIITANRLLGSVLAPKLMGRLACLASWPSWGLWTENLSGSWRVELTASLRCDALEALWHLLGTSRNMRVLPSV